MILHTRQSRCRNSKFLYFLVTNTVSLVVFTSRDKKTGAYATTVSAYGFIKLKNFLPEKEVDELKAELDREILKHSDKPFYKQQLTIQRGFLDNEGVGDVELIMVPKVFASTPKENTSYISLVVALPVRGCFLRFYQH